MDVRLMEGCAMERWAFFTGRVALLAALAMTGSGGLAAPSDPAGAGLPAIAGTAITGAPVSRVPASGVQIQVAPGDWGSADPRDIQVVLDSVASEFRPFVARRPQGVVKLRVVPRGTAPRVLYERGGEGEYVVQLTARDDRWFQYAYQFAHELCHILSNFDHKDLQSGTVASGNQWFEESLCETASLFTLKRMAASWAEHPPGRKWIGCAPMFASYAEQLLAQSHRHLPANQSLGQWYAENQPALHDNPYLREKNELVAAMLLPLFEQDPSMWRAIAYLNANPGSAAKSFSEYLADWHGACPIGTQEHVGKAMNLLGVSAKPAPPTWLARINGQGGQASGQQKPPDSPEVSVGQPASTGQSPQ